MIIVYSFESIGLLNKERNLDMRLSNPESLIKTSYKDLKVIYSGKYNSHQINPTNDFNIHLKKDFVLNKINIHSKKSKENYIETINKILIEGAFSQMSFESSVFNKTQNDLDPIKTFDNKQQNNNENLGESVNSSIGLYVNNRKNEHAANNEDDCNNEILYFDL